MLSGIKAVVILSSFHIRKPFRQTINQADMPTIDFITFTIMIFTLLFVDFNRNCIPSSSRITIGVTCYIIYYKKKIFISPISWKKIEYSSSNCSKFWIFLKFIKKLLIFFKKDGIWNEPKYLVTHFILWVIYCSLYGTMKRLIAIRSDFVSKFKTTNDILQRTSNL